MGVRNCMWHGQRLKPICTICSCRERDASVYVAVERARSCNHRHAQRTVSSVARSTHSVRQPDAYATPTTDMLHREWGALQHVAARTENTLLQCSELAGPGVDAIYGWFVPGWGRRTSTRRRTPSLTCTSAAQHRWCDMGCSQTRSAHYECTGAAHEWLDDAAGSRHAADRLAARERHHKYGGRRWARASRS